MSFYNMMHGVNPSTFFIMPMLGEHHPEAYPRFRDCFLKDEERPEYDNHIHVYTRVGGNNRGDYQEELQEMIYSHPNYVTDFDDDFDNTYATYIFSVPEQWKQDFDKIANGDLKTVSKEYQERVRKVFPKLSEQLNQLWGNN